MKTGETRISVNRAFLPWKSRSGNLSTISASVASSIGMGEGIFSSLAPQALGCSQLLFLASGDQTFAGWSSESRLFQEGRGVEGLEEPFFRSGDLTSG